MPDQYSSLLEWRRSEGAARGLSKLPKEFYASTAVYLAEARRSFESEVRENPSGRKSEISRQTHQRASQVARDIVEARMTKVLSAAFQTSVGGARELPNALPEERELFDRLVRDLTDHRRAAAPYLEATGPTAAPATLSGASLGIAPSPESAPTSSPGPTPARPALVYVRILQDSKPIQVGRDTVDLRQEDVLSLPPETARLLIEAKIAEAVRPPESRPIT